METREGWTIFDCNLIHVKQYGELDRKEILAFYSSYNTPILFEIYQRDL